MLSIVQCTLMFEFCNDLKSKGVFPRGKQEKLSFIEEFKEAQGE